MSSSKIKLFCLVWKYLQYFFVYLNLGSRPLCWASLLPAPPRRRTQKGTIFHLYSKSWGAAFEACRSWHPNYEWKFPIINYLPPGTLRSSCMHSRTGEGGRERERERERERGRNEKSMNAFIWKVWTGWAWNVHTGCEAPRHCWYVLLIRYQHITPMRCHWRLLYYTNKVRT